MQRATVNFEMDMGRIPGILNLLASEEGNQLLNVAARLSCLTPTNQVRDLATEINNLEMITTQLKQYLKMMDELNAILNGTVVPQPVPAPAEPVSTSVDDEVFDNIKDLKAKLSDVKEFTKFMEAAAEGMQDNDGEGDDSEEG